MATFDKWAYDVTGLQSIALGQTSAMLKALAAPFPREDSFVIDEVHYILGRFPAANLGAYVGAVRAGRGTSPQMDQATRERLLAEVVIPYNNFKALNGLMDFHDLAAAMATPQTAPYDVIVVDETQDLSANQLRAVMAHASPQGIVTFVTDAMQRIYPRGTTWAECGINAQRTMILNRNYRNTKQIASLTAALLEGLPVDPDGTPPSPDRCSTTGPLPVVLKGTFGEQWKFALSKLRSIDLETETVGFLHLKGGGWFDWLRQQLAAEGFEHCELQGAREWPGEGNIALSTVHSAKGLEFDHVFILGLKSEHAPHGDDEGDEQLINARRLIAMGIGRARKTVTIGAKRGEEIDFLEAVEDSLYEEVVL